MRISSLFSLLGFILLIVGTFCPLLSFVIRMNVYALNKPYGVAMVVVAVLGAISVLLPQRGLTKALSISSLLLVVLLYAAAVFKVNTAFSFIPFKGISSGLSHLIKFRWGWYLLFIGGITATFGSLANKRPRTEPPPGVV